MAPGTSYLFAGQPHAGSSALATAHVDINNCTLAVPWDAVADAAFLRQVVRVRSGGRCLDTPTNGCASQAALCSSCGSGSTCVTNALASAQWCGPCQAWCVPLEYTAPS